jgi:hypothetical protein
LFFAKKSLTKTDRCAGALSWRRNEHSFSILGGVSFRTHSQRDKKRQCTVKKFPHTQIPVNYTNEFREMFEATTWDGRITQRNMPQWWWWTNERIIYSVLFGETNKRWFIKYRGSHVTPRLWKVNVSLYMPGQALCVPWVWDPKFQGNRRIKVVRLSGRLTGRLYPQEIFLVLTPDCSQF